jgi:hypothetical protein
MSDLNKIISILQKIELGIQICYYVRIASELSCMTCHNHFGGALPYWTLPVIFWDQHLAGNFLARNSHGYQ